MLIDKGDAKEQFKIGEFYRDGYGTEKNIAKAKEYFKKSYDQGYQESKESLDKLNR